MCRERTARRLTALLVSALIAAFLMPAPLQGAACHQAWHRLYAKADRSIDIDLGGVHRQHGVVLTWVRFTFMKDQRDQSARPYRSMLQQWAYQCTTGRHALMQFAEYRDGTGAGELVASGSRKRYEWSSPEPDSLGAAAMRLACAQSSDSSASLSVRQI